jgi:hypothetical protein
MGCGRNESALRGSGGGLLSFWQQHALSREAQLVLIGSEAHCDWDGLAAAESAIRKSATTSMAAHRMGASIFDGRVAFIPSI